MKVGGAYDSFKIKQMDLQLFNQHHGSVDSLGIRAGNFVFSCDVVDFPEESERYLYDTEIWLLDCLGYASTSSHAGLDKVFYGIKNFAQQKYI